MTRDQIDRLIEEHLAAEKASDPDDGMYADGVIHAVGGSPHGVLAGPQAAKQVYEVLTANIDTEHMDVTTRSTARRSV